MLEKKIEGAKVRVFQFLIDNCSLFFVSLSLTMSFKTLVITPPFTQLNTSYPATCYIKGFLEAKGEKVDQCDLSIELFHAIFSKSFMEKAFNEVSFLEEIHLIDVYDQREHYLSVLEDVIQFLVQPDVTLAHQINRKGYLPFGHRSDVDEEEMMWSFGSLGILDKAKHLATLFIEELGDFIQANIDEFFSFTKYAEQIASSASSFDLIEENLNYEPTLIEEKLQELMLMKLAKHEPNLVCFTIPFPGNLFSALRCAQLIKRTDSNIKVAFGGGYCNTELRSLEDPRIFDYIDYISLDDGEGPLLNLIHYLKGDIEKGRLERTYCIEDGSVIFVDHLPNTIHHHSTLPVPTYEGLLENGYLSFLDVKNPMHRMWSDGQWNKLTVSHGCYWKQCSFCDVSLDYIGNYQNTTASALVDKIEALIEQTGIKGFHFVDEAAPPKMLKSLASELIERKINIVWWTNIRFEKTFTPELCDLLAQSGCIAVTGGLEVASDRLLEKMKKGVSIEQVAKVTAAFSEHNIMVHAYLMYGFPTQTEQETIDALEVVRQLFENACIHSAFWHRFTTTVHSPVGMNPDNFDIQITGPIFEGFAQNDLIHEDPKGADHGRYTTGLNIALNNYMNGIGLEEDVREWFDFDIPSTTIDEERISNYLS